MLKAYALEHLRPGMTVGRDVLKSGSQVVAKKGVKLTDDIINLCKGAGIFSVYIEEVEVAKPKIPGSEHLLDDEYVKRYDVVATRTHQIYNKLLDTETLDVDELNYVVGDEILPHLASGAKAVSQIHNMSREGLYLIHHVLHVAILAALMAKWMRWPMEKQKDLVISALLHDVGKQKVPAAILDKQGKLTDDEFRQIRKHPDYGYNMLKLGPLKKKQDILNGVLQHHERMDGSGYPNKNKRELISEFGRLLAVLDIYDAMAADKIYVRRRSPFDVFEVLNGDIVRGKLDPEFGIYFIKNLGHALNGNWVALNNGERGRIVYIDESRVASLPIVQVSENKFIDLNRDSSVKIESILTANEVG